MSDRWTTEQLAAGWRWVLVFEYAGATYYMGTEAWDLLVGSQYVAVTASLLDVPDVEEAVDLWVTDAPRASVALSLMFNQPVGQLVSRGYMLDGVRAELAQVYVGGTWADRRTVLVGTFTDPEYGGAGEPVTLSLEENVLDDTGSFPDDIPVFDLDAANAWLSAGLIRGSNYTFKLGARFPTVFGVPGAGLTAGSPCQRIYTWNNGGPPYYLVWALAAHPVGASTVTIIDGDGNTQVANVYEVRTPDGRVVSVAEHTVTAPAFTSALPDMREADVAGVVWDNGGGLVGADGSTMRAGELISYALERSAARVDYQSLLTARPLLDEYQIDTYLDERVSLSEWLLQSVLEVLPISMVNGPRGVYPLVWAWTATATDAAWQIDTAVETDVTRLSRVSYEGAASVANTGSMSYRVNPQTNNYEAALRYTGDVSYPAGVWTDDVLRASYGRFGQRVARYETGLVSEDLTASRVLAWKTRRYAMPSRHVVYAMPPRYGNLRRGDVVTLTDADVGFSADVALVESIRWTDDHGIEVSLRVTSHA